MTDTANAIMRAALQTIAGCGLDAAGMARTATIALQAAEEPKTPQKPVQADIDHGSYAGD